MRQYWGFSSCNAVWWLLAPCPSSCYAYPMTITQTVDIPADRRLIIDVPREIPAGKTIIAFTPAADTVDEPSIDKSSVNETFADDCPLCAKYRDPVSGALRPNAETIAAIEEGRAMMRGEIPAQRFTSLEELLTDLRS